MGWHIFLSNGGRRRSLARRRLPRLDPVRRRERLSKKAPTAARRRDGDGVAVLRQGFAKLTRRRRGVGEGRGCALDVVLAEIAAAAAARKAAAEATEGGVARSWVGLNAGVFLIRNCQWSLDFMDAWASMGPASPQYARWGKTLKATLSDKPDAESDDQSALAYLLLKNPKKWGARTYLENQYYFQGYWAEIVDKLDGVAERYRAAERRFGPALRRRHAEGEHALYAAARNAALRKKDGGVPGPDGGGQKASAWRRPFVTHFTGCNPCGGRANEIYSNESCAEGMRRALNLADDQVLRAYGFRHAGPLKDDVRPLVA
ncbi:Galactomannan galactosyltransferase 1 [Triticum urartu]|uniref:Galactomannan galactosyltransferase 1 n=1 Tax=Triticum urartu TaxID=4572 RepID=M7YJ84_TRIUA|nr:Galactomannan galactosyltransferase 1 [Triticum urartu]